jgi:hypothetical protein
LLRLAYKVTNPSPGVYHYEYALYNENLDRAIQSFRVPLGPGANISNIGFHAPPQHPGWLNDGTLNDQGYSSTPWSVTQTADSITWNTETFAQNQNANAIRWGTLYNFRFDADQAPQSANATVGFFKIVSSMMVAIQGPAGGDADSDAYIDTYSYCYCDTNSNGDSHSYGYTYGNSYADCDLNTDSYPKAHTGAKV